MKRIEQVIIAIVLFGLTLKYFNIHGKNIITVYGLLVLIIFYFALSFLYFNDIKLKKILSLSEYKRAGLKRIIAAAIAGYFLSVSLAGDLYKLMHYSGSLKMLLIGAIVLLPIIVISFYFYLTRKTSFSKMIFTRTFIVGVITWVMLLKDI